MAKEKRKDKSSVGFMLENSSEMMALINILGWTQIINGVMYMKGLWMIFVLRRHILKKIKATALRQKPGTPQ